MILAGLRVRYMGARHPPGPLALGTVIEVYEGRPGFRPNGFWTVDFGGRGAHPVPAEQLITEDAFNGALAAVLAPNDKAFLLEVLAAHDTGISPQTTTPESLAAQPPKTLSEMLANQRRMGSIVEALRGGLDA